MTGMQPLLTLIKLLAILQVDGMVKKVMAANNEVGTLYPVEVVARVAAQAEPRPGGGSHTLLRGHLTDALAPAPSGVVETFSLPTRQDRWYATG